jgi:hypothetical protein
MWHCIPYGGIFLWEGERKKRNWGRSSYSLLLRGTERFSTQRPLVLMSECVIGINFDFTFVGRSVKLQLALASRVIPGFRSHRGSCPRYLLRFRRVVWFSVNFPCLTADQIQNTQGCYEYSSILFPICTVASGVKSMRNCFGGLSLTLVSNLYFQTLNFSCYSLLFKLSYIAHVVVFTTNAAQSRAVTVAYGVRVNKKQR